MDVKRSKKKVGIIGVMGHAGAGHVHSHAGFVQDDTAGFAVASCLLRRAFPVCTTISSVVADIDTGTIIVRTQDGGTGVAHARRGITPYEETLSRRALGFDAVYSQNAAFAAFGRIYGQGCMELPVALQTATCLAVIDTFEKRYPGHFVTADEDMPGKVGKCIGAVVDIDGIPVSVMATLNANDGGLGPDEDLEGNIMLGEKGRAMKELGLDQLPTIVLEAKAYAPPVCKGATENRLWIRINEEVDNRVVFNALSDGVKAASIPHICSDKAYGRGQQEMARTTRLLGEKIAQLGQELAAAEKAHDKVRIVGELAVLISQDAGGVTFMSSALHDVVGGGGLIPGGTAVLSMVISESAFHIWKIPAFTAQDSDLYLAALQKSLPILAANIDEARKELQGRRNFLEQDYENLFTHHSSV
ncbi:hypothetical protein [Desulfosediminicola ganghwensis]|uniref:hypothetical protein n=1 Tax=Desulfosediminicola ganghwensis TaxID=2569540 RepID=UPI0010AB8B49|nr:hypothetical protein [Desulfosediminicola ganghwensis]